MLVFNLYKQQGFGLDKKKKLVRIEQDDDHVGIMVTFSFAEHWPSGFTSAFRTLLCVKLDPRKYTLK